jgi:hypothetical protein
MAGLGELDLSQARSLPLRWCVASDVGGEDRGEFSFDRWAGQLAAPLGY